MGSNIMKQQYYGLTRIQIHILNYKSNLYLRTISYYNYINKLGSKCWCIKK